MIRHDKSTAIKRMNTLGKAGQPFVFMIDFEMEKILISNEQDAEGSLSFQFPNASNVKSKPNSIEQSWTKHPISKEQFSMAYHKVMEEILLGNTFLLNLSFPTPLEFDGSLADIFDAAKAKYKLHLKDECVVYSPETFVKIIDGKIYSYPMKGTIDADQENALATILADEKELAEHYTIVDLIRNDLSIIAKDVHVTKFRYPDYIKTKDKNLIQISSEIKGTLPYNYKDQLGSLLFAMLPAGSICGAPKKKTVEIIQDAEGQKRGYYTGICGYFDGHNLDSGVMIRYVEKTANRLQYRSGGGITHMSDLDKEYQEIIDKVYIPNKLAEDTHTTAENSTKLAV